MTNVVFSALVWLCDVLVGSMTTHGDWCRPKLARYSSLEPLTYHNLRLFAQVRNQIRANLHESSFAVHICCALRLVTENRDWLKVKGKDHVLANSLAVYLVRKRREGEEQEEEKKEIAE